MSRSRMHPFRLAAGTWLSLLIGFSVTACGGNPPTNFEPPGSSSTAPTQGTAIQTVPCDNIQPLATRPETYLAAQPSSVVVPGAGEEEENDRNEGDEIITPIASGEPIDGNPKLQESVIPAPPIGAAEKPTDVVAFQPATNIAPAHQLSEPNVAVDGQNVLMTWNDNAAKSLDGGGHYQYIDSSAQFAESEDGGFCCDQLVQHDSNHGIWLWVLQSWPANHRQDTKNFGGGNRIRVKVANDSGAFLRAYDFTAQQAGMPSDAWLDQSKIGLSNSDMYLSLNSYHADRSFVGSVVWRVSLADMAAGQAAETSCFNTTKQVDAYGNPLGAIVPARAAGDTMYLATHYDNSRLAVWSWPDSSPAPMRYLAKTSLQGGPAGYPLPTRTDADGKVRLDYHCQITGSADPATDWCAGTDDRITSAWLSGNQLGVAWNAGQDPANGWQYPSIAVALLDAARISACTNGECILAKPSIRAHAHAFGYAAVAPNKRGDLGVVFIYGGGTYQQSCGLGVRNPLADPNNSWDYSATVFNSDRPPEVARAGDYLGITAGPSDNSWTSACMSLKSQNPSYPDNATVHFQYFGRRADSPTQ